ncbi:putative carbonyl reductase [Diaporthe ampelina]|uniref:Putative carbonyl reductase n=1 Tax=Diaporthe ampelina TaxID=1214573 RepID=A0A0G2IDC0_9PEZI|nr:putative carbonyl reductase [Diaporthe ampelina]
MRCAIALVNRYPPLMVETGGSALRSHDNLPENTAKLPEGEAAVKQLQGEGIGEGVEAIQIDISNEDSLTGAVKQVGISGDKKYAGRPISEIITLAVTTNAAGAAASVERFVPLLSRAENPRVVFTSSGGGSLKLAHDFGFVKDYPAYSVSQAAENMVMLDYHHRFPDWNGNDSNPGFRATKINNYG